jgi:hypothetical protein
MTTPSAAPTSSAEPAYGTPAVAAILGVGERAVRSLIRSGRLGGVRLSGPVGWNHGPVGCRWSVPHSAVAEFLRSHATEAQRLRANAYFSGRTRSYTTAEAADILGVKRVSVWDLIDRRRIEAEKLPQSSRGSHWYLIHHTALVRYVRSMRSRAKRVRILASLRNPEQGAVAATADAVVRRGLSEIEPQITTSLFALGQITSRRPTWLVVIDWELWGKDAAQDAAERLAAGGECPLVVGVASEDGTRGAAPGLWDVLLTRPITAGNVAACVQHLYAGVQPH